MYPEVLIHMRIKHLKIMYYEGAPLYHLVLRLGQCLFRDLQELTLYGCSFTPKESHSAMLNRNFTMKDALNYFIPFVKANIRVLKIVGCSFGDSITPAEMFQIIFPLCVASPTGRDYIRIK